jgi:AMP nucleosidase
MRQDDSTIFARFGVRDVEATDDADKAVARITALYEAAVGRLCHAFQRFVEDGAPPGPIDAHYPFVGVRVAAGDLNLDGRLAYGTLHDPGIYGTTLTDPQLFGDYYRTQLGLIMQNHRVPVVTGVSSRPIPLPFVVDEIGDGMAGDRLQAAATKSSCERIRPS